jgi:hypothetical protein
MWNKIRQKFTEAKQKAQEELKARLSTGYESTEEEIEQKSSELDDILFKAFKDRFVDKSKYLNFIMSKKFEAAFNQDEKGLPRRWKPSDDIAKIFLESRQQSEELLEYFAVIRLQPEQDNKHYLNADASEYDQLDSSLVVLSLDEANLIKDKFYREAQTSYLQAQRDQVSDNLKPKKKKIDPC